MLREWRPELMYLTTSDFIQHKHAPGETVANDFHAMVDRYLGELDALGAVIVMTAGHGMNANHAPDGSPAVLYVLDLLDEWLGPGRSLVILQIADPYVVHHGALGAYATVYVDDGCDLSSLVERLESIPDLETVLTGTDAAERFELPPDRIGDIVLLSSINMTIGSTRDRHDLGALDRPLRSHGGLSEQIFPFVVNRKIRLPAVPRLRNFGALNFAAKTAFDQEGSKAVQGSP